MGSKINFRFLHKHHHLRRCKEASTPSFSSELFIKGSCSPAIVDWEDTPTLPSRDSTWSWAQLETKKLVSVSGFGFLVSDYRVFGFLSSAPNFHSARATRCGHVLFLPLTHWVIIFLIVMHRRSSKRRSTQTSRHQSQQSTGLCVSFFIWDEISDEIIINL